MPNQLLSYWNLHKIPILLVLGSLAFYTSFAYDLDRTDFIKLISLFAALFFMAFKLIQFEKWNIKFLFLAGLVFRMVFLWATPSLSQDYFRFIWDGELILQGINPYLYVPDELMTWASIPIAHAKELFEGMGTLSAAHFSNYPPLNQLLFTVAVFFGGKSILGAVITMRLGIILADVGIFYFGRKMLKYLNRSPHLIFWYFLNPLVIIELTGNLHFEGVMLAFFLGSLFLLTLNKFGWAAVVYSLSIGVKLIPLLFLPLFIAYLGRKKAIRFFAVIGIVLLVLFAPFYTPVFFDHYTDTIALWFSNFEFNAGIYNLIKQTGISLNLKPWEMIRSYGKITPVLIILLVGFITFFKKIPSLSTLIFYMLWILSTYYFLATIVHPWYLVFLIILCLYTDFRFPLFWSAAVILSYTAYGHPDFKENLGLLFLEYLIVFGFLGYEIVRLKGLKLLNRKN